MNYYTKPYMLYPIGIIRENSKSKVIIGGAGFSIQLYKASGLSHIEFGTESFCNESLQDYNKISTLRERNKKGPLWEYLRKA